MTKNFGARLRAERERKGIGLDAIADSTKINRWLFEALERDDASRWPCGLFRRAFIRAYAKEIGLDAEATVREFLEHFPDPSEEPLARGASSADAAALRLILAEEPKSFAARVNMLLAWSRSASAAAYDLAIVIVAAVAIFLIAGQFWTSLSIASLSYYVGGVLVLGNSPAGWMVSRSRKPSRPTESLLAPALPKPAKAADPDHETLDDSAAAQPTCHAAA